MKIIQIFRVPLLIISTVSIIILFTSYGNKKVHPDLNTMMVDAFLKKNNLGDLSIPEFKKYTFLFEGDIALGGRAIVKDGLFSDADETAAGMGFGTNLSTEGPVKMTPKQWIVHGGFSADVPEVPASLRHFYDPTRSPGGRYLTDIANARIMGSLQKYVLTNPHMDGVEWAIGSTGDISEGVQDHKYTWEHGKIWMQMALRETNQEKKNEYMAGAWRCLGETLHMIADNGCPPHVRNDAHPSPLMNNNTWFGNPDPYEELVDVIRQTNPDEFVKLSEGAPDLYMKMHFESSTKVEEIAESMAVFTNDNFVTNETISGLSNSGWQIKQITHPEHSYLSPLLENMTYSEKDNSYNSSLGIKQCVESWYFKKILPPLCYPYVNMECVKSQAKVLFPNIIEAGKNTIRLYIPKLSVEIISSEKNMVKGEIKHKTDAEYPKEIKYTGEVILLVKDKNEREIDKIKTQAKNGIFEKEGIKLEKDQKIFARIEFGGVTVESPEFMSVSDNVYGVYQGTYTMQINEASLLEARLDQMGPQTPEMKEIVDGTTRHQVKMFISDVNWIKDGAQGGPVVTIKIGKTEGNENYYETTGLKFTVYNESNFAFIPKFLTPLKDQSNAGTKLDCLSNGFHIVTAKEKETITMNATFKGNDLVGEWKASYKGKVLWSATFTAKKIFNM